MGLGPRSGGDCLEGNEVGFWVLVGKFLGDSSQVGFEVKGEEPRGGREDGIGRAMDSGNEVGSSTRFRGLDCLERWMRMCMF